jgi:hypothetical protein
MPPERKQSCGIVQSNFLELLLPALRIHQTREWQNGISAKPGGTFG